MKLSACMIVKNEEAMLRMTLPDLVKSVDEVILVDTGSTDGTVEYAKSCGARVYYFSWVNDFSAARNESLKHATGDWIIWIDADEYLKPDDFAKLKDGLAETKADSFMLQICECPMSTFKVNSYYLKRKVFKNGAGFHFERPINEQLYEANGQAPSEWQLISKVPIYHWGNFKNEADMEAKKIRNIALLERMVEQNPEDGIFHYLLAENYREIKRLKEAVAEYRQVLELKPGQGLAIDALTNLAWSYYKLKELKLAHKTAQKALELDQNNSSAPI
ncbi:MAG: glycosyltransferase, partial [Candidatus Margulisbacteria bacterium]|nr:glycosyltransferase [Candidatus Margulisiibacteriota bacterium]